MSDFNVLKFIADNAGLSMPEALEKAYLEGQASVEPKQGHWIMTGDYYTGAYGSIDYVKCSCCGEDSLEEGDYCPNCGAKMDKENTDA